MERFIKEYANYQKKILNSYRGLWKKEVIEDRIERLDRIVKARDKGLITVDETMREIRNIV